MNKFLIKDQMLFFYIVTIICCFYWGFGHYQDGEIGFAMWQSLCLGLNIGMIFHYLFARGYIRSSKIDLELIERQQEVMMRLNEVCHEQNRLLNELKKALPD